jgi:hypothetical protein
LYEKGERQVKDFDAPSHPVEGDRSEIPNPADGDVQESARVVEPKPVDEQRLGAAINNLMMSGVKANLVKAIAHSTWWTTIRGAVKLWH